MPSISQAKLAELESYRESLNDQRHEKVVLEQRIRRFDDILDKIVRAAEGMPLVNRGGYNTGGYSSMPLMGMDPGGKVRKVSTEERHEFEIKSLNERITHLESRLASVVALAVFAKDHKA